MTQEKITNARLEEPPGLGAIIHFRRVRLILRALTIVAISTCALILAVPVLAISRFLIGKRSFLTVCGVCLARLAEVLGPVPIKLAQMASYRTDLLPAELLAPLGRLQDRVGGYSVNLSRMEIEQAIGRPVEAVFHSFCPDPIGIGSVANVYRAVNCDGRSVAIKIVRNRALISLEQDLALLKVLLSMLAKLPFLSGVPVREVFDYVSQMVRDQADMATEASALYKFREDFAYEDRVRFPEVHQELSNRQTLVMSYVGDAKKITDPTLTTETFKAACDDILRVLYGMMFKSGHIHCDLHPGNIFVRENGTVYLVDAGMTGQLTNHDRQAFRRFFVAFALQDRKGFAQSIISSAIRRPAALDEKAVFQEAGEILDAFASVPAGDFFVAGFVHCLFELQRRHGLYGAPGFVNAIWALVMLEGIVKDRYPELDFQAAAVPFFTSGLIEDAIATV